MKTWLSTLRAVWQSREVRGKLLITLAIIALFRFFAHIPLAGVDIARLRGYFAANQALGVLDIISGGTLANFSVLAVGLSPYITASILIQVMGFFVPRLKEMQKESEGSRAQLQQWTRLLTIPVAIIQSLSLLFLLRSQQLLVAHTPVDFVVMIAALVSGSLLVMWMGELLTKHGVGNGTSVMIFLGIVSQIPTAIARTWATPGAAQSGQALWLLAGLLGVLYTVVFMYQAVRRVPIQQAKRVRGASMYGQSLSHLPLKVNQFGVMPVIFALPILSLPTTIGTLLLNLQLPNNVITAIRHIQIWFTPGSTVYNVLYFAFVFAFTFFSIFVYFNPNDFSEDLKKSGVYIPTIRPGKPTAEFLKRVLSRLAFIGGLYLGVVAVLPLLAQQWTGITTLTVGGTGLLIVVSVVLDTVKSLDAQLVHDEYERYKNVENLI